MNTVVVGSAEIVALPPSDTDEPFIVIDEFVSAEFGMLLSVLDEPEIVLFVNVSVVALPTRVSVPTGKVITDVPAVAAEIICVVPEVEPDNLIPEVPKVGRVAKTN